MIKEPRVDTYGSKCTVWAHRLSLNSIEKETDGGGDCG